MTDGQSSMREEKILKGIGVSPGVAIAPAFLMASQESYVPKRDIASGGVPEEICRLEEALIETRRQIKKIQSDLARRAAMGDASILDAHLMVLDDRTLIEEIVGCIRSKLLNAEWVVKEVADRYAKVLSSMDDAYLRERVSDVKDVARRIIRNMTDAGGASHDVPDNHIIVAEDLAPSETAAFRRERVRGIATDHGSITSHTAVMARALEIPAVVGLHDVTRRVSGGEELLIDGNRGIVIVSPSAARLEEYGRVVEERRTIERNLRTLREEPAVTTDGRKIALSANTEDPEEIGAVKEYGAEGVGLFRSEYLFLSQGDMVGEDEQAEVYSRVAAGAAPQPVIIRTLDMGGDKFMRDGNVYKEANPFLGCRSIRLSLLYPEIFKVQLRAILRASATGNVKVMYPMISSEEEIVQANALLEEAKSELKARDVPFNPDIEIGVMIEIPSAALVADALARHVSFFSLGTNDLVQYTLAVDRINDRVAYLYQPTHPAVLILIHSTIEAGHRNGIWVGVCGEMAADPLMTPLLVGLGVDELSVAPSAVPLVKDSIRHLSYARAQSLADTALKCKSAAEVLEHCRRVTSEVAPELLELI